MRTYIKCALATFRFRGYRPQKVTWNSLMNWLRPYTPQDQHHLLSLLDNVKYLTEEETRRILVNHNRSLLNYLNLSKIPDDKIIYVQLHDAGSSSPVMLNMLRDAANLERRGCQFVGSNDVKQLNKLTSDLEEGAIIYVDDFVGTGDQFEGLRKFIGEYIPPENFNLVHFVRIGGTAGFHLVCKPFLKTAHRAYGTSIMENRSKAMGWAACRPNRLLRCT
ncbi:MAG TPA: hypothetical protein VJT54_03815 [Verrucomicrobiae bacterium]|nr:hypothetical protein [Verrucomicrobiae bacterium]